MIEEISVSITFQGTKFSPKVAEEETGLHLVNKKEPGDIERIGKYKGTPIPYGACDIEPPDDIDFNDRILWLAELLDGKLELFYKCGAEEPRLYIGYFYKDQCNLSLSKEELSAISKLGLELCFSCYDMSGDDEKEKSKKGRTKST